MDVRDVPMMFRLRNDGHELIDAIVRMGIPRRNVYKMLALRLNVQEHAAHFAQMRDLRQLEQANKILSLIQSERFAKLKRKEWRTRYHTEIFTDKAVLQAVGRRNRWARMAWWQKAYAYAGAILWG